MKLRRFACFSTPGSGSHSDQADELRQDSLDASLEIFVRGILTARSRLGWF